MRRLFVLLLLVGCGGESATAPASSSEPTSTETETAEATPSSSPETAAAPTGPAPDGSAGSFILRFAEGDEEGAAASEVSGFFPAPVPTDGIATTTLDAAPSYHIGVDRATVAEDFELNGTYFVFVQANDDQTTARLLRGHVGLSNNFQDGYTGTIAAFTFPPLWPEGGPEPTLTLDRMGDEEGQVATATLSVSSSRPAWVQPLNVPAEAFSEDVAVTAELELTDETLQPFLLYRTDRGLWEMEDFRVARSEVRRRDREGETTATTPYAVYPDAMDASAPEAYLLVIAP